MSKLMLMSRKDKSLPLVTNPYQTRMSMMYPFMSVTYPGNMHLGGGGYCQGYIKGRFLSREFLDYNFRVKDHKICTNQIIIRAALCVASISNGSVYRVPEK